MIVVADTSVLNYLIRMKRIELLQALYGRIVIAHAVRDELLASAAPAEVRSWAQSFVSWIDVDSAMLAESSLPKRLGLGERETIEVALKLSASEVLMDDKPGRLAAEASGLHVSGTLAVLLQAARLGFLEFEQAMSELTYLGFRMSDEVAVAMRRLARTE